MTDATTFDLSDFLSQVSYPSETVTVYLDEAVAYEIAKIQHASTLDPENEELQARLDELIAEGSKKSLTFVIQGVSRGDKSHVLDVALEKHPLELDMFGRPKANRPLDSLVADLTWALHIKKISTPDGREMNGLTEADARALRTSLPKSAADVIENTINDLSEGAASGYEAIVQETGFLSQR